MIIVCVTLADSSTEFGHSITNATFNSTILESSLSDKSVKEIESSKQRKERKKDNSNLKSSSSFDQRDSLEHAKEGTESTIFIEASSRVSKEKEYSKRSAGKTIGKNCCKII